MQSHQFRTTDDGRGRGGRTRQQIPDSRFGADRAGRMRTCIKCTLNASVYRFKPNIVEDAARSATDLPSRHVGGLPVVDRFTIYVGGGLVCSQLPRAQLHFTHPQPKSGRMANSNICANATEAAGSGCHPTALLENGSRQEQAMEATVLKVDRAMNTSSTRLTIRMGGRRIRRPAMKRIMRLVAILLS